MMMTKCTFPASVLNAQHGECPDNALNKMAWCKVEGSVD